MSAEETALQGGTSKAPLGLKISLGIISVAAVALVLVSTGKYGAGTWWDGAQYIRHAREFLDGDGLSILYWPPGYPFLLALLGAITTLDPYALAAPLNALAFGGIAWLTGMLLFRVTKLHPAIIVVASAWLTVASVALLDTAVVVSTEPLFTVCLLAFFLAGERYRRDGSPLHFAAMVVLALAAFSLRYVGVVVILTGLVVVNLQRMEQRETWRKTVAYGLYTCIPVLLWFGRNLLMYGSVAGSRGESRFAFTDLVDSAQHWIYRWFVPGRVAEGLEVLVPVLVLAGAIAVLFIRPRGRILLDPSRHNVLSQFTLLYLAFVIVISSITAHDSVADRLLLPLQIPLAILLLQGIAWGIRSIPAGKVRRVLATLALVYGVLWIGHQGLRNVEKTSERLEFGAGGTAHVAFRQSPMIAWLQEHPEAISESSFSNASDLLYMEFGTWMQLFPERTYYNSDTPKMPGAEFEQLWESTDSSTVIWFTHVHKPFLYTIGDVKQYATVDTIKAFNDGVIYWIVAHDSKLLQQ